MHQRYQADLNPATGRITSPQRPHEPRETVLRWNEMMRLTFHAVCLTAFLFLVPACDRDTSTPSPPDPFPESETLLPTSACSRSPEILLAPPPEELGAPPPIAQPSPRPRLPGQATHEDLVDPVPGALEGGVLETSPQISDFPPLPENPPGASTFFWTGLTPCSRILPGSFVPAEVVGATGMVAVQTAPGADDLQLLIQVAGLPPAIYLPWLAARAADGRYLFTALAPFEVTSTTELIVRALQDPALNDAVAPGIPVEITPDSLHPGAPVTDTALAFPLIYYRYWFITAVSETDNSLREPPRVVLSGEAKFPVPQLRTAP